jgi:hypothetical protein
VINVCVNNVSTILNLTHSAINWLHCSILPTRMYRSALLRTQQVTRSLPPPTNECQRSVNDFFHCVKKYLVGFAVTVRHNQTIGRLSIQQWWCQHFYYVLKMSINRASTTFVLASWKLQGLCCNVTP